MEFNKSIIYNALSIVNFKHVYVIKKNVLPCDSMNVKQKDNFDILLKVN